MELGMVVYAVRESVRVMELGMDVYAVQGSAGVMELGMDMYAVQGSPGVRGRILILLHIVGLAQVFEAADCIDAVVVCAARGKFARLYLYGYAQILSDAASYLVRNYSLTRYWSLKQPPSSGF